MFERKRLRGAVWLCYGLCEFEIDFVAITTNMHVMQWCVSCVRFEASVLLIMFIQA